MIRETVQALLQAERQAGVILAFQPLVIPGLLQTEDYARALLRGIRTDLNEEEIEELVRLKMSRQRVLRERGGDVTLRAVIGEAAIRQEVGGREVMLAQLQRLRGARPEVVRVLPFQTGAHLGLAGGWVLTEGVEDGRLLYFHETTDDGEVTRDADVVLRYEREFERLRELCDSATSSWLLDESTDVFGTEGEVSGR